MFIPFALYDLTGSAMAVSASFVPETIPIILLSPIVGNFIDNHSRKNLLISCQLISALAVLLCVVTSCKSIYILYFTCSVLSICNFVYNNTINAYMPQISKGLNLEKANTIVLSGVLTIIIALVCLTVLRKRVKN